MTEFDDVLTLTPTSKGLVGEVSDGWLIGAAINGGLLMALGARALAQASVAAGGGGDVLTFSAAFLSATQPGQVLLTPEVLRVGRRFSTAQVSISQPEPDGSLTERLRMLATMAEIEAHTEPVHRQPAPPSIPDPQRCIPASAGPPEIIESIAILRRLDLRLDPATAGFGVGAPTGVGELRGWVRFVDGRDPDVRSLPFFLDAFPPVAFDLGAMGWAPTIEFTGYVRGLPAPGWLQVQLTTSMVGGGLLEEDCVLWDSRGRVVAQSRQLAGIRLPEPADASMAPRS